MRKTCLVWTIAAVLGLAAAPIGAQVECPGDCDWVESTCVAASDPTTAFVKVGGLGAMFNAGDNSCDLTNEGLYEGQADVTFDYDRDAATPATKGLLTITVHNTVCGGLDGRVTQLWFSTPASVSAGTLLEAKVNGVDVTSEWTFGPLSGNPAGCFGAYDWALEGAQGNDDIDPGITGVFKIQLTGAGMDALTACDVAYEGSQNGEPDDVASDVVIHFQSTGEGNALSEKAGSNCTPEQYVDLVSLTAAGGDGEVLVEWVTAAEIDNAGFYLLRRNSLTGQVVRLNPGLIPAAGDINEGAYYSWLDATAVNGVLYEYVLVDVELSGLEGRRPGVTAVANPLRPRVRLVGPAYGTSSLQSGVAPVFRFDAFVGSGVLQVSADPTFSDRAKTLSVPVVGRKGLSALNPAQSRAAEQIARSNHSVLYWRVVEGSLGSATPGSATYSVGYRNLGAVRPGFRVERGARWGK